MMNWEEIKSILEENEMRTVVKAIFSFETGLTEEKALNELVEFFFEDDMPNFLDVDLSDKANELLEII